MSKPGATLAHDGDTPARVRWSSRRPLRRLAAILTSLAIGAGLALVGVAAPASAHHNTISATAVCDDATDTFDITWTIENSENRKETITKSSNEALVSVGTVVVEREVKTFTQKDVVAGAHKLDLSAKWDNGNTQKNSGEITLDGATCRDDIVDVVTICHAQGPYGKFRLLTLPVGTFYQDGHVDHERDVYPGFAFIKNGRVIVVEAQGDQSRLTAHGCCKTTKISAPVQPGKQDLCGIANDRILAPAPSKHVTWKLDDVVNGKSTALGWTTSGYTFEDGTTSKTFQFTFTNEPCPVEVPVPAKPAKVDECGVALDTVLEPKSTEGVNWTIGTIGDGKATATATTLAGFKFADGTTTKTWDFEFESDPCLLPAPVEPIFIEQCGLTGDGVELPADVDHVTWSVLGDPKLGGLVTVNAVAEDGYAFPADAATSFSHIFTDEPCPPTIVAFEGQPIKRDDCGAEGDSVVVPAAVEHMSWQVIGDPKKGEGVTVEAVAHEGYAFGKDVQTSFDFEFDSTPCPAEIPLPVVPTSIDICGHLGDKVNLPDDSAQILWDSTGSPSEGNVVVTATAANGFVFPGDTQTAEFIYEFTNVECIEPSLKGSVATGECVADSPWIFFNVELTDPDKQSSGNTAALVLTDGTNTHTIELGDLVDGKLNGEVLWPGASVDEIGTANGWPGWAKVDNQWIEVDDNFAWTRGDIDAKIVVNPETPVAISYPAATPECATGAKGSGDAGTPAASPGTGLASTGFAGTTIAIVAGIIVVAGLAFLVIARIRRKRA